MASSFIQLTCLTVLSNNLFPGPLWSSPWSWTRNFILHAFLHPIIIIFRSTCPYRRSLFCCNINAMSSTPSLSLSSLLGSLSFSLTPHIHPAPVLLKMIDCNCNRKWSLNPHFLLINSWNYWGTQLTQVHLETSNCEKPSVFHKKFKHTQTVDYKADKCHYNSCHGLNGTVQRAWWSVWYVQLQQCTQLHAECWQFHVISSALQALVIQTLVIHTEWCTVQDCQTDLIKSRSKDEESSWSLMATIGHRRRQISTLQNVFIFRLPFMEVKILQYKA